MLPLLSALCLSAAPTLPAPFDKLAATEIQAQHIYVYARPGALKALPTCPAGEACFEVQLEEKGKSFCLAYSSGPSEDPTFVLHPKAVCQAKEVNQEPLLSVGATTFIVPGNGSVYSAGFTDNYFDARRKFEVKGDKVHEVSQPFYFVGLKRKVGRTPLQEPGDKVPPLVLRSEKNDAAAVVATLVEGAEVEVLLSDGPTTGWFLVRTGFGLVGWYHSPSSALVPDALGLFFNGD